MNFTKLMETVLSLLFGPSHQRFSRNPEVACSSGLRISHGWAEAALSRTHLQATQRGDSSRAATEGNPAPAQMHRGHALAEGPLGMAYDCASDVAGLVRVLHVEKVTYAARRSRSALLAPASLAFACICSLTRSPPRETPMAFSRTSGDVAIGRPAACPRWASLHSFVTRPCTSPNG